MLSASRVRVDLADVTLEARQPLGAHVRSEGVDHLAALRRALEHLRRGRQRDQPGADHERQHQRPAATGDERPAARLVADVRSRGGRRGATKRAGGALDGEQPLGAQRARAARARPPPLQPEAGQQQEREQAADGDRRSLSVGQAGVVGAGARLQRRARRRFHDAAADLLSAARRGRVGGAAGSRGALVRGLRPVVARRRLPGIVVDRLPAARDRSLEGAGIGLPVARVAAARPLRAAAGRLPSLRVVVSRSRLRLLASARRVGPAAGAAHGRQLERDAVEGGEGLRGLDDRRRDLAVDAALRREAAAALLLVLRQPAALGLAGGGADAGEAEHLERLNRERRRGDRAAGARLLDARRLGDRAVVDLRRPQVGEAAADGGRVAVGGARRRQRLQHDGRRGRIGVAVRPPGAVGGGRGEQRLGGGPGARAGASVARGEQPEDREGDAARIRSDGALAEAGGDLRARVAEGAGAQPARVLDDREQAQLLQRRVGPEVADEVVLGAAPVLEELVARVLAGGQQRDRRPQRRARVGGVALPRTESAVSVLRRLDEADGARGISRGGRAGGRERGGEQRAQQRERYSAGSRGGSAAGRRVRVTRSGRGLEVGGH